MNDKLLVQAIVSAVHTEMAHGMEKDDVLRSLSRAIRKELYAKVKQQI